MNSKNVVKPAREEIWIVVTSAFHMNRVIFLGEKNEWKLIPYSVDFTQPKNFKFSLSLLFFKNLNYTYQAAHEWLGLIAYYLMGRTSHIL